MDLSQGRPFHHVMRKIYSLIWLRRFASVPVVRFHVLRFPHAGLPTRGQFEIRIGCRIVSRSRIPRGDDHRGT